MKVFYTLFILLGLTNCNNSSNLKFKIEKFDENGHPLIGYVELGDTTIFDSVYSLKLKRFYDSNGNITREGRFLNNKAIGEHLFLNHNSITVKREYLFITPDQRKLLTSIDSSLLKFMSTNTTFPIYLNQAIFYDSNGDTIKSKSSFWRVEFDKPKMSKSDSIQIKIDFFEPQIDIKALELYVVDCQDTSMIRIIQTPGNKIKFKQKLLTKNLNRVSGFGIIHGTRKANWDFERVIFFDKEIK